MTDPRSPSGKYRDWASIIGPLRKSPGKWVVRLTDQPYRLLRTVRDRSSPDLHLDDGRIEARAANSYVDPSGKRRADVYLRFLPHQND